MQGAKTGHANGNLYSNDLVVISRWNVVLSSLRFGRAFCLKVK
jgi:hypothetical protein